MEERILTLEEQVRSLNAHIHSLHSVLFEEVARIRSLNAVEPFTANDMYIATMNRITESFTNQAHHFRQNHG